MTWLYSIISSSDIPHYALRLFPHGFLECRTFYKMKPLYFTWASFKALANEDTLLPTQMFPLLPVRATFVADTNFVSGTQKMFLIFVTENVSDFVQKHFVSATNVSQFAHPKKHHGQQCVRNNVSSFTRALSLKTILKKKAYAMVCILAVPSLKH